MEQRERRVAQILRDFMEAYVLAAEIGAHLRAGNLDFGWVNHHVGEYEESALFRLKEETHALFRFDVESSESELHAEELFDLAVGALFHEAMKFREGYYLTTSYGPRLERMMSEGTASGSLAEAFRSVIEAGTQRMLESEVETAGLFDETRDQLVILLRQLPHSGAVARSLVEDPDRTEQVFGTDLTSLLESISGSAGEAYRSAIENLLENGHFAEARALLEREDVQGIALLADGVRSYAAGMEQYFSGEPGAALDELGRWISEGAASPDSWHACAGHVLETIAGEESEPSLAQCARSLLLELKRP